MAIIGSRYEIAEKLGSGGMGTVYRGTDTQTGHPVAIKLLRDDLASGDPNLLQRFKREGDVLRDLNHPNIVKMLDMIEENGQHYLVMDYIEGGDLAQLLRKNDNLPLERVLQVGIELADALTRAHHLKIIHRDFKPANILLTTDGTPRLTDFGIAHVTSKDRITDTGFAIGTLDYLSPEALNGETIDNRTDIWSFGVVLFEMLTGKRPFEGDTIGQILTSILTAHTPDLEKLRPDCPVALVDLIYRMLEKDRNARIRSMRQVGAELEAILQGEPATIRVHTPTPIAIATIETKPVKAYLPTPITPFLGREQELSALHNLLTDPSVRVVTILAPGGMGKTRLGLQATEQAVNEFPDGVYFVDLTPLTSPDFISQTIAESIKLSFHGTAEPRQQLLDHLQDKEMLLLMDNFEHVIRGAALVADMLQTAPHVKVLTTSRERLDLRGEQVFTISGMDFPDWETPEDALKYAAVKLFVQSARRVRLDFQLESDDLAHVVRICRLVQGMPLGIELAAAWIGSLELPEIVDEIERGLDILETTMRDVPERHRSIRAVLEYSWNLLTLDEQQVFSKLSVFNGGFTRDAAIEVAGANLRSLTALVNKSLLVRRPDGRYQIHELLRQYASSYLPSDTDAYERHSRFYNQNIAARTDDLWSKRQIAVIAEIDVEIENIRSAVDWAFTHARFDLLSLSAYGLYNYYQFHSLYLECKAFAEKLEHFLRAQPVTQQNRELLGISLVSQAWMCLRLGEITRAKSLAEESRTLLSEYREPVAVLAVTYCVLGDFQQAADLMRYGIEKLVDFPGLPPGLGLAQSNYALASAEFGLGQYEQAREHLLEAIQHTGEEGWFKAYLLNDLGSIARALGQLDEARQHYETSYAIRQQFNDPEGMAVALNHLGQIAIMQGDYPRAQEMFTQSGKTYQEIRDQGGLAISLAGLGNTARALGDYDQAQKNLYRALEISHAIQFTPLTLTILLGIADLLFRRNQVQESLELLSAITQHPITTHETRQIAQQHFDEYSAAVSPEVKANLTPVADLDQVVQRLLKGQAVSHR